MCTTDNSAYWMARQSLQDIKGSNNKSNDSKFRKDFVEALQSINSTKKSLSESRQRYSFKIKGGDGSNIGQSFYLEISVELGEKGLDKSPQIHIATLKFKSLSCSSGAKKLLQTLHDSLYVTKKRTKLQDSKLEMLSENLKKSELQVREAASNKNDMENELLGKFVVLLNTKKRKIRQLLEDKEKLEDENRRLKGLLKRRLGVEKGSRVEKSQPNPETPPRNEEEFGEPSNESLGVMLTENDEDELSAQYSGDQEGGDKKNAGEDFGGEKAVLDDDGIAPFSQQHVKTRVRKRRRKLSSPQLSLVPPPQPISPKRYEEEDDLELELEEEGSQVEKGSSGKGIPSGKPIRSATNSANSDELFNQME